MGRPWLRVRTSLHHNRLSIAHLPDEIIEGRFILAISNHITSFESCLPTLSSIAAANTVSKSLPPSINALYCFQICAYNTIICAYLMCMPSTNGCHKSQIEASTARRKRVKMHFSSDAILRCRPPKETCRT